MNLDAYTVRKIVPRLMFAVIAINLSIYLCVAAIDITNVVGGGLGDLLRQPFIDSNSYKSIGLDTNPVIEGTGAVGGAGVIGLVGLSGLSIASAAGGAAATTGFLATMSGAAIAVGGAAVSAALMVSLVAIAMGLMIAAAILATLVIRYGAIIFLTVVSPIAIACLVLPGTERYFKQWWSIFFKMLLVYPIIAAIFAMSDILGAILLKAQTQSGQVLSLISIFVVVFAVYAPLFMVPFAFKMAGGMLGQVYDFMNRQGVAKGAEKLKKWRENPNSMYAKRMRNFKGARDRYGLTAPAMASGVYAGIRNKRDGGKFTQGYKSEVGGVIKAERVMHEMKELLESETFQAAGKDDHILQATGEAGDSNDEIRQWFLKNAKYGDGSARFHEGSEELEQAVAAVQRVRGLGERESIEAASFIQRSQSSTGFDNAAQFMRDVSVAAGGNSVLRTKLIDMGKTAQMQAGRLDVAGATFGTTEKQVAKIEAAMNDTSSPEAIELAKRIKHGSATDLADIELTSDAMQTIWASALNKRSSSQWSQAAYQAHEQLSNGMKKDLEKKLAAIDNEDMRHDVDVTREDGTVVEVSPGVAKKRKATREEAVKHYKEAEAGLSSFYEIMGQSSQFAADNMGAVMETEVVLPDIEGLQIARDGKLMTVKEAGGKATHKEIRNGLRDSQDSTFLHRVSDYYDRVYKQAKAGSTEGLSEEQIAEIATRAKQAAEAAAAAGGGKPPVDPLGGGMPHGPSPFGPSPFPGG